MQPQSQRRLFDLPSQAVVRRGHRRGCPDSVCQVGESGQVAVGPGDQVLADRPSADDSAQAHTEPAPLDLEAGKNGRDVTEMDTEPLRLVDPLPQPSVRMGDAQCP